MNALQYAVPPVPLFAVIASRTTNPNRKYSFEVLRVVSLAYIVNHEEYEFRAVWDEALVLKDVPLEGISPREVLFARLGDIAIDRSKDGLGTDYFVGFFGSVPNEAELSPFMKGVDEAFKAAAAGTES